MRCRIPTGIYQLLPPELAGAGAAAGAGMTGFPGRM
jgi:hypothetical protein